MLSIITTLMFRPGPSCGRRLSAYQCTEPRAIDPADRGVEPRPIREEDDSYCACHRCDQGRSTVTIGQEGGDRRSARSLLMLAANVVTASCTMDNESYGVDE